MPKFSKFSRERLDTCHPELVRLFEHVIEHVDCRVIDGYRGKDRQNELFALGKSKLRWGKSKHNIFPSHAVDVVPYPVDWRPRPKNPGRFYHLVGYVKATAHALGIRVRCGADWDSDNDFEDQTFDDTVHYELVGYRRQKE